MAPAIRRCFSYRYCATDAPDEPVHIVCDGARPHLNVHPPAEFPHFHVHILLPYSPFLNPVEQAHSCFKADVKRHLAEPAMQLRLADPDLQRGALSLDEWRRQLLLEIGTQALDNQSLRVTVSDGDKRKAVAVPV